MPRLPPFDTNEPDSCSEDTILDVIDVNRIEHNYASHYGPSQLPLPVSSEVEQAGEQFNDSHSEGLIAEDAIESHLS